MIPERFRLKHMKDFEILFKNGFFVGAKSLGIKVLKIEPDKYPRRKYKKDDLKIGFVVSKKHIKTAVKRNKYKRQMREIVRKYLKNDRVKKGFLICFVSLPNLQRKTFGDISQDIESVLHRGKLLDMQK